MATINYASVLGIQSLPAAIVFVVLYVVALAFFVAKSIARPTYVFIILTLFCSIRVAAFILRALLSHVAADAENVHVLLAYEILYNIGFFGLLFSAYSLVTTRVAQSKIPLNDPVSRILRLHFLFRLALMAAVAIGITGAIDSSLGTSASTLNTGTNLRKIATYIFFVCAILVLLQTFSLARVEHSDGNYHRPTSQIGTTYGVYILLVISLLLVVREAFFIATANNPSRQNNEAFWYPFSAVTELIAVVLFAAPGLVPPKSQDT